jgi:RNA polymerase sigma-70 factor (ECF subfamily)
VEPPPTRRGSPDRDAFRLLYEAHFRDAVHLAGLFGVPARYREDVAQEVFKSLWRELGDGFDLRRPFRPWLAVTTMSRSVDWRRLARNREQPAMEADAAEGEQFDAAPDPEEAVQTKRMRRHLELLLDDLPQELRIVVVLAKLEGMPGPEIAKALGIPVGTVKSRSGVAERRMKEAWERKVASGAAMVMPFALWSVDDLLDAQRAIPPAPPGMQAAVWSRLAAELGLGIAVGVAGAGAGAAGLAKLGAVLSAKKVAAVLASALVLGAVGYLIGLSLRGPEVAPEVRAPMVGARSERPVAAAPPISAVQTAASSAAPPAMTARAAPAAQSATAAPRATATSAPERSTDAEDRTAIDAAQAALVQGDVVAARAALARIKGKRFAVERAELARSIAAYQDGGP